MRKKTGKKAKTDNKAHERKRAMIIRKLQEAMESRNDNYNSSNFAYIPQRSNAQASPRRDSTFVQSNINNRNENIEHNNYRCYRCEHFLEISPNLSRPFCKRVSTVIGQCEADLSFIQAIVYLKSAAAHVSQIPIDKLQEIFNKWNTRNKPNFSEKRRIDNVYIEQLGLRVTEDLSTYKETAINNVSTSSTCSSLFDISYNALPQAIYESHSKFSQRNEDLQDENLVLIGILNKYPVLTSERNTYCKTENVRNKEFTSLDIIPETDSEEENFEYHDICDDVHIKRNIKMEHQREYIEKNNFFNQERNFDDLDEYKSDSSGTNQSIKSLNNCEFTPISSHCNLTDLDCNHGSTKVLTQINISQTDDTTDWKKRSAVNNSQVDQMQLSFSNIRNGNSFKFDDEFQIDNDICDNVPDQKKYIIKSIFFSQEGEAEDRDESDSSSTQMENNDATENTEHDSAYSTSNIRTFNHDSILKSCYDNQHTSNTNTEHRYELQNRKKEHEEVISSPLIIELRKNRSADDQDEYKFNSLDTNKSTKSFNNCVFTPISRLNLSDLQRNDSSIHEILSQISEINISQTDDATHWKMRSVSNSPVNRMQLSFSNICNDDNFKTNVELQINDSDINTDNTDATDNVEHDSAYSTNIRAFNYDSILKSCGDNQRTPSIIIKHHYNLRNRKKKQEIINSPSIIKSRKRITNNKRSPPKEQSVSKKHKSEQPKNLSKEKEESNKEMISANWLNFTMDSLNLEQVIFESLKVILSRLCDEKMAEEYVTRRYWKSSLEEEAINAVLNISDIFRMEKKPNICRKEIVMMIKKTLDEMTTCVQLNKTSVWNYRVRIILEMCNSISICVEVIDHLTAKLKPLQSMLSEVMSQPTISNQLNFSVMINQLHFIFYALNIALQKYRTVIPNGRQTRSAENVIHVTNLWKARYVDEELEDAGLNTDDAEKQWINALDNFKTSAFAEKSISLIRLLL